MIDFLNSSFCSFVTTGLTSSSIFQPPATEDSSAELSVFELSEPELFDDAADVADVAVFSVAADD